MLPTSEHILPPPFAWIRIPAGQVTLERGGYLSQATTFEVPAFEIAKYPLTKAQFEKFIQAGGYAQRAWWTDEGWQVKEKEGWQRPGPDPWEWSDTEPPWNPLDHPVYGVSWYEAVAFCLWLSDVTDEHIMLPAEQEWQRAAQGDDYRAYTWGDKWVAGRCNSRANIGTIPDFETTPVRLFEGKGDSPFKVVDMIGNVWEWCRTDFETGAQDIHKSATERVWRGGSHWLDLISELRCGYRDHCAPGIQVAGFRLARSV